MSSGLASLTLSSLCDLSSRNIGLQTLHLTKLIRETNILNAKTRVGSEDVYNKWFNKLIDMIQTDISSSSITNEQEGIVWSGLVLLEVCMKTGDHSIIHRIHQQYQNTNNSANDMIRSCLNHLKNSSYSHIGISSLSLLSSYIIRSQSWPDSRRDSQDVIQKTMNILLTNITNIIQAAHAASSKTQESENNSNNEPTDDHTHILSSSSQIDYLYRAMRLLSTIISSIGASIRPFSTRIQSICLLLIDDEDSRISTLSSTILRSLLPSLAQKGKTMNDVYFQYISQALNTCHSLIQEATASGGSSKSFSLSSSSSSSSSSSDSDVGCLTLSPLSSIDSLTRASGITRRFKAIVQFIIDLLDHTHHLFTSTSTQSSPTVTLSIPLASFMNLITHTLSCEVNVASARSFTTHSITGIALYTILPSLQLSCLDLLRSLSMIVKRKLVAYTHSLSTILIDLLRRQNSNTDASSSPVFHHPQVVSSIYDTIRTLLENVGSICFLSLISHVTPIIIKHVRLPIQTRKEAYTLAKSAASVSLSGLLASIDDTSASNNNECHTL